MLSQIASNAVLRHPLNAPRFDFLRGKTAHLFNHAIPDSVLREALELIIAGDNMAAAFVLSRGTPMPLDDAVDGLMAVEKVLTEILEKYRAGPAILSATTTLANSKKRTLRSMERRLTHARSQRK